MNGERRLRHSEHFRLRRRRESRRLRLLGTAAIAAGAVRVSLVVGALVLTQRMRREMNMLSRQSLDSAYLGDPTAEGEEKASPI